LYIAISFPVETGIVQIKTTRPSGRRIDLRQTPAATGRIECAARICVDSIDLPRASAGANQQDRHRGVANDELRVAAPPAC
jgi:hypothetical protein